MQRALGPLPPDSVLQTERENTLQTPTALLFSKDQRNGSTRRGANMDGKFHMTALLHEKLQDVNGCFQRESVLPGRAPT